MEDATTLNLWAWARNSSDIPKLTWLTIVDRSNTVHDVMPAGRGGLTFRVIVQSSLIWWKIPLPGMNLDIHVRMIGGLVLLTARANHATITTLHHLAATIAGMRMVIVTIVVAAQDATTVGAPGSFVASRVLPWTASGSARGRATASAMTHPGGVTTSTAINIFVMPEACRWLRHMVAVTLHFTRMRDPRRDVEVVASAVPPVLLSGMAVQ
jgi:hypothetical protein